MRDEMTTTRWSARAPAGEYYEAERRRAGISYAASEVKALQDEARRAGIQPLVIADRPIGP